jgi:hypothetical protein
MSKNAKVKKYEAKGRLGEKELQEYSCSVSMGICNVRGPQPITRLKPMNN